MGPVANVVNTHFAASTPNFLILEYTPDDSPPRRDLVRRNHLSSRMDTCRSRRNPAGASSSTRKRSGTIRPSPGAGDSGTGRTGRWISFERFVTRHSASNATAAGMVKRGSGPCLSES